MAFTDNDIRILTFIEQTFWDLGEQPTNERIAQRLGIPVGEVIKSLKKPESRALLLERGLVPNEDQELLSPEQILAANMVFNAYDKRSMREKLKLIQITEAQMNAWMRQPAFTRYLERRADLEFAGANTEAKHALMSNLRAGSLEAVKYWNEMSGIYNPKRVSELDLASLVMKMMEILSRHVSGEVLLQVASELEALGPGVVRLPPVGTSQVLDAEIIEESPFELRL